MKNEGIKVYDLKDTQEKKKLESQDISDVRVQEFTKKEANLSPEGQTQEQHNLLKGNPFLFRQENDNMLISIEDFIVPGKKEIPLGVLVRNKKYSKSFRKKYVRRAFTTWKKGAKKYIKETLDFGNRRTHSLGNFYVDTISFGHYINLVIGVLLLSLIAFKPGIMWTSLEGKSWFKNINDAIIYCMNIKWYQLVVEILWYLSLAGFAFVTFYNVVFKDLKRLNNRCEKIYHEEQERAQNELRKKYKFCYHFYKHRLGNPKPFSPLLMDKVAISKVDFVKIDEMMDVFVKRAMLVRKSGLWFKLGKFVIVYSNYIGIIVILGYLIYQIIVNFLKG